MRKAEILFKDQPAGILTKNDENSTFIFDYYDHYQGPPISLTMPTRQRHYEYDSFPSFFDGLLPEGPQLEALLKQAKLDRGDYFGQLVTVGADLVGAVTVRELT